MGPHGELICAHRGSIAGLDVRGWPPYGKCRAGGSIASWRHSPAGAGSPAIMVELDEAEPADEVMMIVPVAEPAAALTMAA